MKMSIFCVSVCLSVSHVERECPRISEGNNTEMHFILNKALSVVSEAVRWERRMF